MGAEPKEIIVGRGAERIIVVGTGPKDRMVICVDCIIKNRAQHASTVYEYRAVIMRT